MFDFQTLLNNYRHNGNTTLYNIMFISAISLNVYAR